MEKGEWGVLQRNEAVCAKASKLKENVLLEVY